jgi:periplasmic protein TonB
MRIIYIRSLNRMSVQILNQMPDARVDRGESIAALLQDFVALRPQRAARRRFGGRAGFVVATMAVHVVAAAAFISVQHKGRERGEPEPMFASLIETPVTQEQTPDYTPPLQNVTYALPPPEDLSFEAEAIAAPVTITTAIADPAPQVVAPPLIDDVDYVRSVPPVYPKESQRRREYGTVILRVLVDALGRPAQVQIERSSGHARLDAAGREAVEQFLFRPYEVNGIARPAQVLIPIEFTRRAT